MVRRSRRHPPGHREPGHRDPQSDRRRPEQPRSGQHLDRRTLWALAAGETQAAELAEGAFAHLLSVCPECREAFALARQRLEGDRRGTSGAESTASAEIALDEDSLGEEGQIGRARDVQHLMAEVRSAMAPVEELLAKPPESWSAILSQPALGTWGAVDLLIHRCRRGTFDDPRRAEGIAVLAVSLADRLDAERYGRRFLADLRAVAWAWLGNARRVLGGLPAAEQALSTACDWLGRGVGAPRNRAQVLGLLASLRRDQLRFEEAYRLLDRALELYAVVGDRHLEGKALVKKASVLSFEGRPGEAVEVLERALLALDPARDARLELCARHGLALALVDLDRLDEAEAILVRCRPLYERFDDALTRARKSWLGGRLAARRGHHDEAIRLLEEAQKRFVDCGAGFDAALTALELASCHVRAGDLPAARRSAREMLPLFRSHDVHRGAIEALVVLDRAVRAEEGLSAELLADLARFLGRARRNPDLALEADG